MTLVRHRVALPTSGTLPRVGKIRLGTAERGDDGNVYRPKKADHFVVTADESGITSPEAAQAFRDRYGDRPTSIIAMLAGATPDDCLEGAWRQYGRNKLKVRCDGTHASVRRATGGFDEQPCLCAAKGQTGDDRDCTLSYTMSLILPDVTGVGVWQLDTGSTISSRRMADFLLMMHQLRGDLRLFEFALRLVAVKVQPEGKTQTVYVLDPQAPRQTPRQMLQQAAERQGLPTGDTAQLPPPAADEEPEHTLDRGGFAEGSGVDDDTPDADPPNPPDHVPAQGGTGGQHSDDPVADLRRQLREVSNSEDGKALLRQVGTLLGVQPTVNKLATAMLAKYGVDECSDVNRLLDQLEAAGDIGT